MPIPIRTYVTDSHDSLLCSLHRSLPDDSCLQVFRAQQIGDGEYANTNWAASMRCKADAMYRAVNESDSIVVWADADVVFLANDALIQLEAALGDHEIAFQRDANAHCAGFWIARCTDRVRRLFHAALDERWYQRYPIGADQVAINRLLVRMDVDAILVPDDMVFTAGSAVGWRTVTPGEEFEVPANIKVFHANWCVGIENKLKLIEQVQGIVRARQQHENGPVSAGPQTVEP